MLGHAQNKGANAIMMGFAAGVVTYTAVDVLKPHWPVVVKLLVSAVTAAAVSALIWFGFVDKKPVPQADYSSYAAPAPLTADKRFP